jgi:pilus assembly protein CpaC
MLFAVAELPYRIVARRLLVVALITLGMMSAEALEPPLQLDINEQETLELDRFSAIYAADRNVVTVRTLPGNRRVILTGVGEGTTSITIAYPGGRTETRRIRVVSQRIAVDDLELLIGDILGIELLQVGSRIAVRGAVRTQSEWKRYRKVVERFDNVIDLVEDLTTRTNIQLDVKVFELSRSGMQELGLEWFQTLQSFDLDFSSEPRGLQYNFSPPSGGLLFGEETLADLNTPVTVGKMSRLSPLLVELRALEERGYARLLAKPQIVAENGGKARFQVGGRLPYPVENGQGAISVDFQEYGTIVEVEPRIISVHTVALVIHAEVSEPDYANTVMNTPGIRAREASTSVQIREGETLAIAGLLSRSEAESRRGLPLPVVAKIPLIGRLFGADRTLFDEIETLILVTPHLLAEAGSTVGREHWEELDWGGEESAAALPAFSAPEGW